MKTTVLVVLLACSLAANAFWYLQRADGSSAAGSLSSNASKAAAPASSVPASAQSGKTEALSEDTARMGRTWSALQGGDLKTLAERLRAAGFPPAMIRALVMAQVQEQFSKRRAALLAQQEEKPYWKAGNAYYAMDPKVSSDLRELGREQSNLLKQLLGPDGMPNNEESLSYERRQFGNLSRDKLDQAQSILGDYNDLRNQIYRTANGIMLPEDREKLSLLEKEQHNDLAALLTPQELENYELRSSQAANTLRSQLALFNPSEDEFRSIFKLQQAFDEKYGSLNGSLSPEQYRERQTHQQELTDQINAVLTPDRIDAYKQSVDPAYQMVNRLVARLELPASAATSVVAVQQDISKRAGLVRSDKSLPPDVRNTQLGALAQEANDKLTAVLGTRGMDAYKQFGGQWVQNLAPRSTPPSGRQ